MTVRAAGLGLLLGGMTGLSGCVLFPGQNPGGSMRANDQFTYTSTPWEPLTVTLYDRREDIAIWTVDVPVGSKVTVRFLEDRKTSGTVLRPDVMQWEIFDDDKSRSRLRNSISVPPADSRLLRVTLRDDTPALPEERPDAPEMRDPDQQWSPVEPKRYRGVPVTGEGGSYYRAD